jgi:hypothetical protein
MKFSRQGRSDKKQYFQLSLGIPLWVTRPIDFIKYQWRKWQYIVRPDHCARCNTRMHVKWFEIEHTYENGRRLLVGNHVSINGNPEPVCRSCLVHELETKTWKPRFSKLHGDSSKYHYRFWSKEQCAITGAKVRSYKDVEIVPYVDMTFCTVAWNFEYISKEAVIECVKNGSIRTSFWGVYKGKMQPMNHKRLFIDEQGRLL